MGVKGIFEVVGHVAFLGVVSIFVLFVAQGAGVGLGAEFDEDLEVGVVA